MAQFLKVPIIVLSQLNRNIETRSNKQPLLSDLKESGCISTRNKIQLSSPLKHNINLIYIKNLCGSETKISIISNNKIQLKRTILKLTKQNFKEKIYLSQKYIFECQILKKILCLTSNHKYLSQHDWAQTKQILDYTKINYTKLDTSYLQSKNTTSTAYVNQVQFNKYLKSYDMSTRNYFNFICNQIILHNSIEQDADIIMILYENSEQNIESYGKKILDLIICKNRNGPTGSCKITFIPKITLFQSIEKTQ